MSKDQDREDQKLRTLLRDWELSGYKSGDAEPLDDELLHVRPKPKLKLKKKKKPSE